jgi:hypothetical protein
MYSERAGTVVNDASKIGDYLDMLRLPDTDVQVVPGDEQGTRSK